MADPARPEKIKRRPPIEPILVLACVDCDDWIGSTAVEAYAHEVANRPADPDNLESHDSFYVVQPEPRD